LGPKLDCLSVLLGSWSIDTANCPRQLLGNGVATEFPSEPSISPPTPCLPSRMSRVRVPFPAPMLLTWARPKGWATAFYLSLHTDALGCQDFARLDGRRGELFGPALRGRAFREVQLRGFTDLATPASQPVAHPYGRTSTVTSITPLLRGASRAKAARERSTAWPKLPRSRTQTGMQRSPWQTINLVPRGH
jgi:hypothetical protein